MTDLLEKLKLSERYEFILKRKSEEQFINDFIENSKIDGFDIFNNSNKALSGSVNDGQFEIYLRLPMFSSKFNLAKAKGLFTETAKGLLVSMEIVGYPRFLFYSQLCSLCFMLLIAFTTIDSFSVLVFMKVFLIGGIGLFIPLYLIWRTIRTNMAELKKELNQQLFNDKIPN